MGIFKALIVVTRKPLPKLYVLQPSNIRNEERGPIYKMPRLLSPVLLREDQVLCVQNCQARGQP